MWMQYVLSMWTMKRASGRGQTRLFCYTSQSVTSNRPASSDVITFCVNKGCVVCVCLVGPPLRADKNANKISGEGGKKKKKEWKRCFVPCFHLFASSSCISKSGSMETHLALSGVLAEREYLTSQIALLFRCSAAVCCYATASSKLSGSGPYSPPSLSLSPFS